MRHSLLLLLWLAILAAQAQTVSRKTASSRFSKYVGKYETNGFIIQVALINEVLVLVVPGAPLQDMIPVDTNRFKSASFDDSYFLFVAEGEKITRMISLSPGSSAELQKISDVADKLNAGDSLLTFTKSTEHFIFLYSETDKTSVNHIAAQLEHSYHKILNDFKIEVLPVTTVRIYPDVRSFHAGVNFPGAPDYLLATAFGKSDFRMSSPHSVSEEDSLKLIKYVAHEFMHCVHLNIDYAPNNPRWLWEGIANFEAAWFFDPKGIDIIKNKQFPPLASLNNELPEVLGYVIIEAIKDIWGFDAVIGLIKKRGDVEASLQIGQAQFEEKIYNHIYRKYIIK